MLRLIAFTSTLTLSAAATAQAPSPLKLTLTQSLVVTVKQDGKDTEKLVAAPETVKPGDVLAQQLDARNEGKNTLSPTLTVPVPSGTVYSGAPTPANDRWSLLFSYDGGKTFGAAPLKQRVTSTQNGKTTTRDVIVTPTRYTHVRWAVAGLKPDESLKFNFRVKVK